MVRPGKDPKPRLIGLCKKTSIHVLIYVYTCVLYTDIYIYIYRYYMYISLLTMLVVHGCILVLYQS